MIVYPPIKSYIPCPTVQGERERGNKREEDQYPTTTYPYNQLLPSLPPSTQPIQYTLSHLLHHSVTYALHPFSQQQCHLSLQVHSPKFIQPLSGPHNSTQHPATLADLSQIAHHKRARTHTYP